MNTLTEYTNSLLNEKSPYLLQHAHNPVDWHPWSEKAFGKAKEEDKPIFLSIGYSTCHWCHVMERESFEDKEVAELMNDTFVSIKVDREERPDIDSAYMSVCQAMTGHGGWPLTIIMTPDKKPFFAATYIPKGSRFGRTGMMELIPRLKEHWDNNRDKIDSTADKITESVKDSAVNSSGDVLDKEVFYSAYKYFSKSFDDKYGGFGAAPKFPVGHNLTFLLRYWKSTNEKNALKMVERTLDSIWMGGVNDHIGGGFHRYSTDEKWLLPHFEKMLYDQAMLALAYTEGYQITGKKIYEMAVKDTLSFILRDLTDEFGGFYSGIDADSEGEEGKFYVWAEDEVRETLSQSDAEFAIEAFNIRKEGNFRQEHTGAETGLNIFYMDKALDELASEMNLGEHELMSKMEGIKEQLLEVRNRRIPPITDDKILTDWNGLVIAALARAYQVFSEDEYLKAAKKCSKFIFDNMFHSNQRLYHRHCKGETAIPCFLDDYAFFIWGMLELYEASFDVKWLKEAIALCNIVVDDFYDQDNGGFYQTAKDQEEILFRKKEIYDGPTPSGNSVMLLNLLKLSKITGITDYEEKADKTVRAFSKSIRLSPTAYTQTLNGLYFALNKSYEIVIAGDYNKSDTKEMLETVKKAFVPNKVVMVVPQGKERDELVEIAPFIEDLTPRDGKATAYVCVNRECEMPVTDRGELERMME